jgi:hypothetical protein
MRAVVELGSDRAGAAATSRHPPDPDEPLADDESYAHEQPARDVADVDGGPDDRARALRTSERLLLAPSAHGSDSASCD